MAKPSWPNRERRRAQNANSVSSNLTEGTVRICAMIVTVVLLRGGVGRKSGGRFCIPTHIGGGTLYLHQSGLGFFKDSLDSLNAAMLYLKSEHH